jgi:hypothetical protein
MMKKLEWRIRKMDGCSTGTCARERTIAREKNGKGMSSSTRTKIELGTLSC